MVYNLQYTIIDFQLPKGKKIGRIFNAILGIP